MRYVLVGGLAATMNVCSRILYNLWTSYSTAIVLAHFTGMTMTYMLARTYVFPSGLQTTHARSILAFLLVQGVALLQSWAISLGLAEYVLPRIGVHHFVHEIAHVTGVGMALFTNYFGNKHWAFRTVLCGAWEDEPGCTRGK
jgi:putative flippase GtrA